MNSVSLWTIAAAFNRIALASFGGGLSAWARQVVVVERGWMSEEEFLSASTICRIMPGANQVNMAVFVGTKLRGGAGAVASVAGLIALPFVLVLSMGALYVEFRHDPYLQRALAGMASAAVGLTFSVALQQGRHVLRSPAAIGLCAISLGMAAWLRAPLWLTLLLLAPVAYGWACWSDTRR